MIRLLILLLLAISVSFAEQINKKIDIGTTIVSGLIEVDSIDTINFSFTSHYYSSVDLYFLTDTISYGNKQDSALVLCYGCSSDTLWWNDNSRDSIAYINYPDNGKALYIWDEESAIVDNNNFQIIIKSGSLAPNRTFKYALVVRTLGK